MFPHTSNASGAFTCLAILQSLVLLLPPSVRDQQEPTVAAEAPPLVWPSWLVHLEGYQLKIQQGTDQAKNDYLRTTFNTHAPMTQIHSFYLNLLKANDYPGVTGGLETGHTISGVQQNASGRLEADNYPNGQPGPYTDIRIDFSRFVLNGPIRVSIKVTAHPYISYGHEITHRHNLPPPRPSTSSRSQEAADEFERSSTVHMQKYDQPVVPRKGPPIKGLAWPSWLVHIEGQPLRVQKSVNNSSMTAFTSGYTTNMDSDSIRAYYSDLLTYHGYSIDPIYTEVPRVRSNSPASHMGSVKGVSYPSGNPGPRIEILVQYRPVDLRGSDLPMKVDLRVSGFPPDTP
jgi:hypothetical protein